MIEITKPILPLPDETLIQKEESMWRIKLPSDYRSFLMKTNGGTPNKQEFKRADDIVLKILRKLDADDVQKAFKLLKTKFPSSRVFFIIFYLTAEIYNVYTMYIWRWHYAGSSSEMGQQPRF